MRPDGLPTIWAKREKGPEDQGRWAQESIVQEGRAFRWVGNHQDGILAEEALHLSFPKGPKVEEQLAGGPDAAHHSWRSLIVARLLAKIEGSLLCFRAWHF